MKWLTQLALAILLGASLPLAAAAQTPEQFYKGRTVTLIVGFAPGGINDISARVVGKHLGRFIPGNPTIVVQNLPGAGGLGAGNRLYNVAEKDGSVIAGLGRSVPQLARELGCSPQSLRNWSRQLDVDEGSAEGLSSDEREELRRLRRENARLKQERDLLKRAAAFFAKETEPR